VFTHYDVLSVEPTAPLETIRRAWRVKVRLLHPDKHRASPQDVQAEAARETLRVNAAWETLRDPQRRHEYDEHLLQLRDTGLEREQDDPGADPGPDHELTRLVWLSAHNYLNIASFLIIVLATAFVLTGAVLLARMAQ
jgi:curved DNA-binding protein CbpA